MSRSRLTLIVVVVVLTSKGGNAEHANVVPREGVEESDKDKVERGKCRRMEKKEGGDRRGEEMLMVEG